MEFEKLYAKNKAGKIKEWVIKVIDHDTHSTMLIEYGLAGGKQATSANDLKVGKNVGRPNETTHYEQACSEAAARYKKQTEKGYRTRVEDLIDDKDHKYFRAMLAHKFHERKQCIVYPVYVQPKLDGFRAPSRTLDGNTEIWSRTGKVFTVPTELIEELNEESNEGDVFDGELYVHEWRNHNDRSDFQRVSRAVKKYRTDDTPLLQYHIYDCPIPGKTFEERFVNNPTPVSARIRRVETILVNNEEELMALYEQWTTQEHPYEGVIVRNRNGEYLFSKRSTNLLKLKPLDDAEFLITGGGEADRDPGTVVFYCVTPGGEAFEVRPLGTKATRAEYLQNLDNYVGQVLTVEYNGLTNKDIPLFPRGVKIRPE